MDTRVPTGPRHSLAIRVFAGWALCLAALGLAGWVGELVQESLGLTWRVRHIIQALIMSGLVLPGVLLLRARWDRAALRDLGLPRLGRSARDFATGAGIIGVPLAAVLLTSHFAGWASVRVDVSLSGLATLVYLVLTAMLFEALPEELVFRGYIYRNLSATYRRWVASIATVGLFVLLPVALVMIQTHLLKMEVQLGGSTGLTAEYLIILVIFGSFVQYLRVLSGGIWMGIGFHFSFLLLDRILGPGPSDLIRMADIAPTAPLQAVALGLAGMMVLGVLAYPWLSRKSLGWGEAEPDPARS